MHHSPRRPPARPEPQRRIPENHPKARSSEEAKRLGFADTIEDPFGHLMTGLAQYLRSEEDKG